MVNSEKIKSAMSHIYFDSIKADNLVSGRYTEEVLGTTLLECAKRMEKNARIIREELEKGESVYEK